MAFGPLQAHGAYLDAIGYTPESSNQFAAIRAQWTTAIPALELVANRQNYKVREVAQPSSNTVQRGLPELRHRTHYYRKAS